MKGLVVLLAALFAATSVALAAPALPDYKNRSVSVPSETYACDKGTTVIRLYTVSDMKWRLVELRTAFGDTFVGYKDGAGFFSTFSQPAPRK